MIGQTRSVTIQLIGAGLGRTRTPSLDLALEQLGATLHHIVDSPAAAVCRELADFPNTNSTAQFRTAAGLDG